MRTTSVTLSASTLDSLAARGTVRPLLEVALLLGALSGSHFGVRRPRRDRGNARRRIVSFNPSPGVDAAIKALRAGGANVSAWADAVAYEFAADAAVVLAEFSPVERAALERDALARFARGGAPAT